VTRMDSLCRRVGHELSVAAAGSRDLKEAALPLDRRGFPHLAAGTSASRSPLVSEAITAPRLKAIAFDAFPIFDPRPVSRLAETLFPGEGADLSNAWRTRQFEYQWLRALSCQGTMARQGHREEARIPERI
jgi:hypothetical protein